MDNNLPKPSPASENLVSALQHMLRPLVRLLLANGIGYATMVETLKSVFVRVADEDFRIAGKAQTDSRISLLTGVHRKDVKRLRGGGGDPLRQSAHASLSAQLFARWTGSGEYLDSAGRPRPLPRLGGKGGGPTFEGLVTSVSKDIRPRAVLDEWLRIGAVDVDLDDRIRLNVDAFIPKKGFEEKTFYFGHNMHDHMAAVTHNLAGGTPPFQERCAYYGQLSEASVAELAALAQKNGMQALQGVNRRAIELQATDRAAPPASPRRMTFGVYFYSADDAPAKDRKA
ncbi:MAG: hypothetical protein HZC23_16120 [Rhodocyclales bacterium]|nr:hypothetical protein [Rhodocyclales bacterium]